MISFMADEAEERRTLEELRFRSMLIAMHPGEAKKITEILDGQPEEGEFAEPLEDEQMENYQPFSGEEIDQTINLLRRFGVAVSG